MANRSDEQVIFRDYPLWLWLTGLMIILVGVGSNENAWQMVVVSLIGVAFIAFASVLTVTVDHRQETLNLHYRSLFRAYRKAYPLSEICSIDVVEDNERERMYRWELVLWSGEVVPLRTVYSVGKARKKRRAQRIRALLPAERK